METPYIEIKFEDEIVYPVYYDEMTVGRARLSPGKLRIELEPWFSPKAPDFLEHLRMGVIMNDGGEIKLKFALKIMGCGLLCCDDEAEEYDGR